MGLEELGAVDHTAPTCLPPTDLSTLAAMRDWVQSEGRFDVVPEARFRPNGADYEVELWLHPQPGQHDDRIPPHGWGRGRTLNEAWLAANEALREDLYRYTEQPRSEPFSIVFVEGDEASL